MDAPTQKERMEALEVVFAEAPGIDTGKAQELLDNLYSYARKLHRLYTRECNGVRLPGSYALNYARMEKEKAEAQELEQRAVQDAKSCGLGLSINGDPRGAPLGILTPLTGKFNTMGGREDGWRL